MLPKRIGWRCYCRDDGSEYNDGTVGSISVGMESIWLELIELLMLQLYWLPMCVVFAVVFAVVLFLWSAALWEEFFARTRWTSGRHRKNTKKELF